MQNVWLTQMQRNAAQSMNFWFQILQVYSRGSYGKKDGNGELYFDNGNIYRGGWESGSPNGEGVFETKNRKYYGNWRSGIFMQLIKYS